MNDAATSYATPRSSTAHSARSSPQRLVGRQQLRRLVFPGEFVNDALCQDGIRRGLKVTNRISPGYGGWDVGEQSLLFRLCPPDTAGVALNEACFMQPTKSISLLIGAGSAARVDHYFSQCARCWMADCAYRRVPARRTVRR